MSYSEDKLDLIIKKLEENAEVLETISEKQDQLSESIANISLPGANYSIDRIDDDYEY